MITIPFTLTKEFQSSYGRIKYDRQGNGPAVILVHGTPWSSFNWRHLIPSLSQWFTVYYYDLLGYGQSEKAADADVSLGVQNEILTELIDFWELSSPLAVGHDFGGTTILRAHLLNKLNFQKMILIDPVAVGPWGSPFFAHINKHQDAFKGVPDYIHQAIVTAYVQGASFSEMDKETLDGIIRPWVGSNGKHAFYQQIAQADQKYTDEIQILYSDIKIPTLIIWGAEDNWIPVEKGQILHESITDSEFHAVPDAGHLVQEEAPAILLAHILKFSGK